MSNFISINASEIENFGAQIGAANEIIRTVSARLVANLGKDTIEFARRYPSPPRGFKVSQNWTPRQRRFFFAALRNGRIQVPYKRTGHQGRSWLLRLIPGGESYAVEVYNDNSYDRWVQGTRRDQARIHAGRWSSREDIEDAANSAMPARLAEASSELERLFLIRLGK